MSEQKRDLFGWPWFGSKEKTFTAVEVQELVEKIKVFNAGAIDEYLSKHVDEVFNEWLEYHKNNPVKE